MTKQTNKDVGNGWTYRSITGNFPMHRKGWRGAWDAFKAAILRKKRRTVPTELTFSVYTKGDAILVWGGQLAEQEIHD